MAIDSTTANTLVEDQIHPLLIEPLEAASVVLAAGPMITQSSAPIRFKRMDEGFDPSWTGENELIPDSGDGDWSEFTLMPESRKSIKAMVRVSNELIRMADRNVSTTLQNRLVKDVAHKLDDALLKGDGTDNTVTGIVNQPGITKAPLDLTDTDSLLDALALSASREVTPNRLIMNGTDFVSLRKLKDGNGRYILQNDVAGEAQFRLFGVPVVVTNKLDQGQAILADMSQIVVVRDQAPTVKLLDQRFAEYDQVGIRVTCRADLGLLRPEGVILLESTEA